MKISAKNGNSGDKYGTSMKKSPSCQNKTSRLRVATFITHIKLCLLLWFEFFRTIELLLGALRHLIDGYSKLSSASVKCRREIFGRANFHPRVVSLGINVSSKVGDDGRRTGEGKELCRRTEKTPRHYSQGFSTSISFVYTDVLNLGILLLGSSQL